MSKQIITSVSEQMKNYRPCSKEQLRNYVKAFMGISVPDKSMCANHASPMDYLWHSFNEISENRKQSTDNSKDCIVWAGRGVGQASDHPFVIPTGGYEVAVAEESHRNEEPQSESLFNRSLVASLARDDNAGRSLGTKTDNGQQSTVNDEQQPKAQAPDIIQPVGCASSAKQGLHTQSNRMNRVCRQAAHPTTNKSLTANKDYNEQAIVSPLIYSGGSSENEIQLTTCRMNRQANELQTSKDSSKDSIVWAGRGGGQASESAKPRDPSSLRSLGMTDGRSLGTKTDDGQRLTVNDSSKDCIVWAGRGGGKTFLAAIATVLDCIFKPSCKVRILGGSYEQSSRMYDYITDILRKGFEHALDGSILKDGCKFLNGSNIEVLTQSSKSVRGSHIHKLRCDEIELFDRDVFEAAKFITKSNNGITGSMEILSTMHKPYGLMHEVITNAAKNHTPIFQWCVMEVIERCVGRSCSQCPLDSDCQGKAKTADGYLGIDDCITMMRRSSRAGWESEMMCKRPSRDNAVFADFDADVHVGRIDYDPALPLYRTMDFGYINPFVCLWIQPDSDGTIRVIDEYYRSRAPIAVHAEAVKKITPCDESKVAATFCDPAGAGRNDVTGTSAVRELYNIGIRTKYRRSGIAEGLELVRAAMRDGLGKSKLIISPKCPRLIEALQCYHYPDAVSGCDAELPDKDGIFDHPIDALRYFFVNYQKKSAAVSRKY